MGHVISLDERRQDRSRSARGPAAFFFALGCPISYLAAERVERALGQLEWVPVLDPLRPTEVVRPRSARRARDAALLAAARAEARALRLPLVAPDRLSLRTRAALRASLWASEHGAGRSFGLAASRMAFCGGFDLDDPKVLVETAKAVGLDTAAILAAAVDPGRDSVLEATAAGLARRGVAVAPAVRIGERWFSGFGAVPGAMDFAAARAQYSPAS